MTAGIRARGGRVSAARQREAALRLLKACPEHEGHARRVTRLALALFDGLAGLHGMGRQRRFILECAALLHDIGWISGQARHHKTSLHAILDTPLLPFEDHRRLLIGSVARYHRRALPRRRHRHYAELDADDRLLVRSLGGILRVADALDVRHVDAVEDLHCAIEPDRVTIDCRGAQDLEVERPVVARKGKLFEQVFKRKLVLAPVPGEDRKPARRRRSRAKER